MHDLSKRMFYKAKFSVVANEPNVDLLWNLILEIRFWLLKKWNTEDHLMVDEMMSKWTSFKFGGKLFDLENNNRIYGESVYFEGNQTINWACKIVEKYDSENGLAPREWVTEIGFQASDNDKAEISYVVTYSDLPGFIGLCAEEPTVTVPRVISNLFRSKKIRCYIGANRILSFPVLLKTGDGPKIADAFLKQDREFPIVIISPYVSIKDDKLDSYLLVDPRKLSRCVIGNANVYYYENPSFAEEMSWFVDKRFSCIDGAIRVYKPNLDINSPADPYRHRFIPAAFIEEQGEERILNMLRKALAQDVYYYDSMFRIDDCKALINKAQREARIERMTLQSESDIEEAIQDYIEESNKREEAESLAQHYADELDRAKDENYNLKLQIAALSEKAEKANQLMDASNRIRLIEALPNNAERIARYFEQVYPDRIVFTHKAYQSLKECNTKNEILWEVFYHMATTLYNLVHENPSRAYKEFKEKTGWECSRGVGNMTHADNTLMRNYYDEYKGQTINIESHIKSGNKDSDPKSVRVYFAYEPQIVDQIIIGYCGKHLDNYSTKKVK